MHLNLLKASNNNYMVDIVRSHRGYKMDDSWFCHMKNEETFLLGFFLQGSWLTRALINCTIDPVHCAKAGKMFKTELFNFLFKFFLFINFGLGKGITTQLTNFIINLSVSLSYSRIFFPLCSTCFTRLSPPPRFLPAQQLTHI